MDFDKNKIEAILKDFDNFKNYDKLKQMEIRKMIKIYVRGLFRKFENMPEFSLLPAIFRCFPTLQLHSMNDCRGKWTLPKHTVFMQVFTKAGESFTEKQLFDKFKSGRSEIRDMITKYNSKCPVDQRKFVSFDPKRETYTLEKIGGSAPENWEGYDPDKKKTRIRKKIPLYQNNISGEEPAYIEIKGEFKVE